MGRSPTDVERKEDPHQRWGSSRVPAGVETVLPALAALGAASCGTDTTADGRRVWAVLDL